MRCIHAIAVLAGGCLVSLAGARSAQAQITVDESLTGVPTPGFTTVTMPGALGIATFTSGDATVTFNGTASDQGVVNGTVPSLHAEPIIGPSGDGYAGNYLSTGDTGFINISFASPQLSLALLWGSVDLSNQIEFLNNGIVVGTVTGANIDALADGNEGYGGSFYVLLNSSAVFDDIELSSGIVSFESAELEVNPTNFNVPEPDSLGMVGAGLLGLVLARRRTRGD